jgi:hypothetical protein
MDLAPPDAFSTSVPAMFVFANIVRNRARLAIALVGVGFRCS